MSIGIDGERLARIRFFIEFFRGLLLLSMLIGIESN